MIPERPTTERLFSYGTLPMEAVQRSTFGRTLVGTPDALPGFAQSTMKIEDPQVVAMPRTSVSPCSFAPELERGSTSTLGTRRPPECRGPRLPATSRSGIVGSP